MLSRKLVIILTLLIIAGGFFWSRMVGFVLDRNQPPPAEYIPEGPVPDFSLVESHGQKLTRQDLLGKVWVANLMFTSCGDTCPRLTAALGELDRALGARDDVRLVSITITPEYDQPPILREYAEQYKASAKWLFLTGERAQITKLANDGFWLTAGTVGTVTHSDKFVLVDQQGHVRKFYDGLNPATTGQLVKAIADLTAKP